jgi:capsular exopolysaccharide synthesis family protein
MTVSPRNEASESSLTELTADQIRAVPTILLSPSRIPTIVVMLQKTNSLAAEQYRLLAHALEKLTQESSGTTMAVSSASAGEGKTVTSINLAFALAETKIRKIALVDADLRGGLVTETLGMGNLPGLTDVLSGRLELHAVIRRVEKNLDVLPSGPETPHPLGLIRSATWHQLVKALRAHYDCIVVDCPPLCGSDEMPVLEDVIDKVVVVVRSGVSREESVREALGKITPGKLAGFVLNDAPIVERRDRYTKREF